MYSYADSVFWGSADNSALMGDLDFSLMRAPALSAAEIRGWSGKGAHISRENQDTAIVSYADSADTAWIYKIDKNRGLVVGLDLYNKQRDTILLNSMYLYRDTNNMHILREIALRGDTSLGKGGYRFSKVHINDSIPDSLFVAPNAVLWAPAKSDDRISFERWSRGIRILFKAGAQIARISIIDASGRVRFFQDQFGNTREFLWNGITGSGNKVPGGLYIINVLGKNLNYSRGFFWTGKK
jgi:hypothetical protein